MPYIRTFANKFASKVLLLSVPEGSESEDYTEKIRHYLDDIRQALSEENFDVRTMVIGSGPARTIIEISQNEKIDLIMMASHGRGGVERSDKILIGSVADKVVQKTQCPVFLLPLKQNSVEEAS